MSSIQSSQSSPSQSSPSSTNLENASIKDVLHSILTTFVKNIETEFKVEIDDKMWMKKTKDSLKPSEIPIFRKSKFGNYTYKNLIYDKNLKGISGKEDVDGKVIPLQDSDIQMLTALNISIVGSSGSSGSD